VGAGLGFRASVANGGSTLSSVPYATGGRPVLLVSGFGGRWDGVPRRWLPGDLDERRFSYRGQDPAGRPLPYGAADTHDTLPDLVKTMAAQVDAFHRQSGREVAIVAESEGALVAKTYLAATPDAPVDELVMLSPLVQPARVFYPSRGHNGWGMVSGWQLREIGGLFHDLSGADITADMPVVRSLLDHGPAVRDLLACPLPDTRQLALFPLADAVATPHPSEIGIPSEVVPAFHGGLLADDGVRKAVSTYLEDGKVTAATVWPVAQQILRASAAAWQVPELPLTLNREWSGPSGRSPSCDAMAASLRQWLK
ncbi:MAG TPA: alpha/beta hydrolase, partial [Actinomycetes bacterium]|nr:alpha/beta hydrolase [Actinomycetes bacterium]